MKKRHHSYPVIWIDFAAGPGDELFRVVAVHAIVMDRKSGGWKVKRTRAGSAEKGYGLPLGRNQRGLLASWRESRSIRNAGHMFDVEGLTLVGRRASLNQIHAHIGNTQYAVRPHGDSGILSMRITAADRDGLGTTLPRSEVLLARDELNVGD